MPSSHIAVTHTDVCVCVLPKTKSLALICQWLISVDAVGWKTSREKTLKWLRDRFHNLLHARRAVTNDYFLCEVIGRFVS